MDEAFCAREYEDGSSREQWWAERAPVLGKWLWVLFWLQIVNVVTGVVTNNAATGPSTVLQLAGTLLEGVFTIVFGVILLKLSNLSGRYRIAGRCAIVSAAFFLVPALLGVESGLLWWLVMILSSVVGMVAEYQECNAHGDMLQGLNDKLAGKWRRLWKWEVAFTVGMFVCIPVALLSAVLGLVALLVDMVGLFIVAILKMVNLYKTAQVFRKGPVERGELPDEASL